MTKKVIVLVHGIARFDGLWAPWLRFIDRFLPVSWLSDRYSYFRGIAPVLREAGFIVHTVNLPFAASLEETAAALKRQVVEIYYVIGDQPHSKFSYADFHLIAHSNGGLAARYAIAKLGLEFYVATLSTIGTPHLGTSLADYLESAGSKWLMLAMKPFLSLEGFKNLTTASCAKMNSDLVPYESMNRVEYRAYATSQARRSVVAPLRESWRIVEQREGACDGLVSVKSQMWAPSLENPNIPGLQGKLIHQKYLSNELDHFNQCGWWDPAEIIDREAFEQMVQEMYISIATRER